MVLKRAAFIIGLVFIGIGALGFVPGALNTPRVGDPNLLVESFYGRLFGLFPVNSIHSLIHVALGIWALIAARDVGQARFFNKGSTAIYGVWTDTNS